ncbi:MAG: NAD(+)/NADH kinase [Planctomycetota bacterium]
MTHPPPQSISFPRGQRLRVILLSTGQRPHFLDEVERLRPVISQFADIVVEDFGGQEDLARVEADLAIVLGGDGSILRAAHQMGQRQLPVIAVNLGKLGFLADVSSDELPKILGELSTGRLQVVEHLMFDCQVIRNGIAEFQQMCLNEVAVRTGPPFLLMDIHLYVDSELVTTYSGDGLMISTPVGSTAYSLSAGGPILRKDLEAVVITPLSPHTLTMRAVVDSAERVYEMEVVQPHPETSAVVDGRVLCQLKQGDRIRVTRAPVRFKLVAPPGHSYYRTLREKLNWGGQFSRRNELNSQ